MVETTKALTRSIPNYLTDTQVQEVRAAVARGESQAEVARRFGVHRSTVSRIVRAMRRVEPMQDAAA